MEPSPGNSTVFLTLLPKAQAAEMQADYLVKVANSSPMDVNLSFEATDPQQVCDFSFSPEHKVVPANGAASVRLSLKMRVHNLENQPQQILFTIKPLAQGGLPAGPAVQGRFIQQPPRRIGLVLNPPAQGQARRGTYTLHVKNEYPVAIRLALLARSAPPGMDLKLNPESFVIEPGQVRPVQLLARPLRPLTGGEQSQMYTLDVSTAAEGIPVSSKVTGTFTHLKDDSAAAFERSISQGLTNLGRIFLWLLPWIIILLALIFIADLGISGVAYIVQKDTELGHWIAGWLSSDMLAALHDSMLFRALADSIVEFFANLTLSLFPV